MTPEHRRRYELGLRQTELNTILGRIRRRPSGEPTTSERTRIRELQDAIREIKAERRDGE